MFFIKNKKLLLVLFLCFLLNGVCAKDAYVSTSIDTERLLFDDESTFNAKTEELPVVKALQQPLEKPPIKFMKGDLEVVFGGKLKLEYYDYFNSVYLNAKAIDDFGFFKQTMDLTINSILGQKNYGHKALEVFLALRSKSKWGVLGSYKNTSATEINLGDISLGSHEHKASRSNPWFKDAWIQVSLNSILNSKNDKIHYIKAGWFPFQLGRGIALGPFYAAVYEQLGLFSYPADASSPGICISGEILKGKLHYDLYYSKFEDNSASLSDLTKFVRKNQVGRRSSPYRGEGKDDELWALRFQFIPFNEDQKGRLNLEPYIYINDALDQKVEIASDTETQLGAYGVELEYKKNKFKVGGEVAFNYGKEKLVSIDRNNIRLVEVFTIGGIPQNVPEFVDENSVHKCAGLLYKGYSHVLINGGDLDGKPAPVNDASASVAYDNSNLTKDSASHYGTVNQNNILKNRSNRIRPEYKNYFNGWMGILDARYKVAKNLKLSAELGYASGDNDPHVEEVNKKYNGFVGLHEFYMGKRVFAPLFLGQRYIARPLGLLPNKYEKDGFRAKTNNTFSDIIYFGVGATWKPDVLKKHRFKVNPNLMFFWKNNDSYKYVTYANCPDDNHTSNVGKASSFMGAELSLIFNYELITDLTFGGIISLFAPGSYYKDISGVPLKNDFYRDVLSPDLRTGINPLDYRISDECAFYGILSLEYRF